jgi:hypothetical protein
MSATMIDSMEMLEKLNHDLRDASRLLGRREARFLTDIYYQVQGFRTASANQVRSGDGEPNRVLGWVYESMRRLEDNVKRALGEFAGSYRVGSWLQSITGIGPVLSAGLLSHIDIRKAPTAGHIWRFAGLDPTVKWEKKQKRPWNARLRVLCYKSEDCFVKFQNHRNDHYGQLYVKRKEYESGRNERGDNADAASYILTGKCPRCARSMSAERTIKEESPAKHKERTSIGERPCPVCHGHSGGTPKRFGADTEARKHYEAGHLPPSHIHARAMRWTGKMFLSHLHHVMHVDFFGTEPPVPYSFEKCPVDHRHFVPLPNWPWEDAGKGLDEMGE